MHTRLATLAVIAALLASCGGGSSNTATLIVTGLDSRPDNSTCIAPDRPTGSSGYATEDVFPQTGPTGGRLRSATEILQSPDNDDRWYVLEQRGTIVWLDAATQASPVSWLSFQDAVKATEADGDGRMLGMTFHPDWPNTPQVFIYYTGAPAGVFQSVVVRVTLDDIDNPVNPLIETIFTYPQSGPFHKGGSIAFGPDNMLYLALGDGGAPATGVNPAQDTTNLYGSMLRINVLGTGAGYTIPADGDNPFSANPVCGNGTVTGQDCPEIWAWGLRSPFRWSFDNQGRLFLGDVGRDDFEEIDIIERSNNYGWSCREGAYDDTGFARPLGDCPGNPVLTDPIYDYPHPPGDGASVTGGFVYTGNEIPALQGKYIFADYVSGVISALTETQPGVFTAEEVIDTDFLLPSLAQGNDGNIYFIDRTNEKIRRLVTATPVANTIPDDLADTGCVNPLNPTQPVSALIPYEINAPFWSDNAAKERYLAIPDSTTIDISSDPARPDDWDFPVGSVLMKNFRLQGRLIETRLLMRHPDGIWGGYTYEWNDAETSATRVIGGKITPKGPAAQTWIYPSEGQCIACHTGAAGFSLGPETAQLNRDANYVNGNGVAHQLTTLNHIGMFTMPLPDPATLPELPDPFTPDPGLPPAQDLDQRARSWLHTNCSGCHRDGGPTQSAMDWRYTVSLQDTGACNIDPADDLGIVGAKLVEPGDAANSIVLNRLSRRDSAGMPPLGSTMPSAAGVSLITDWIDGLTSCN